MRNFTLLEQFKHFQIVLLVYKKILSLLAFYAFGFEHIIKRSCMKPERSIINIKLNVFIVAVAQL